MAINAAFSEIFVQICSFSLEMQKKQKWVFFSETHCINVYYIC